MVYDIDHFKWINDTHGHQTGDKVLVHLARFVPDRIRSTDILVRWGGEEFAIITPGSDGRAAYHAAEKLRDEISKVVFDKAGTVTCSFGVAQYSDGDTPETFLARADNAMYRAKINGRNRVELASELAAAETDISSAA